jgi:hypothetical protein
MLTCTLCTTVVSIGNLDHAIPSGCYHTLHASRNFSMNNFEVRPHNLYERMTKDGKPGWTAYNFAARIVEEHLADLGQIKSC